VTVSMPDRSGGEGDRVVHVCCGGDFAGGERGCGAGCGGDCGEEALVLIIGEFVGESLAIFGEGDPVAGACGAGRLH
jgi:hypothetical protein